MSRTRLEIDESDYNPLLTHREPIGDPITITNPFADQSFAAIVAFPRTISRGFPQNAGL
jgi:hypothetical protein